MKKILNLLLTHWPLLLTSFVLALLLWRNPFSTRTLIANFEPFPDSFHYIVPPRCWLNGQGWKLCRPGVEGLAPAVPPIYSLLLLPFFLLNSDARIFYLANVCLAFLSLFLFYLILKKIGLKSFSTLLVLTLFVTTYHVYWLPTLAMAENLVIPIYLLTLFFFLKKKLSVATCFAIGITAGLQYGTKFAGLPILTSVTAVTLLRLIAEEKKPVTLLKNILALLAPVFVLFFWFGGLGVINNVISLASLFTQVNKDAGTSAVSTNSSWFGLSYFSTNSQVYLQALVGKPTKFLWDTRSLIHPVLAFCGFLGLSYGLWKTKWRWLSSLLITTVALQLGIISLFYTSDTRYIYVVLPIALIGASLALYVAQTFFASKQKLVLFNSAILIFLTCFSIVNFSRIKSQISLNLRYAETPWWHIATTELSSYFDAHPTQNDKKPIVISAIIPYLIDLSSKQQFSLLPLNEMQDFRGHKTAVWGENNYDNLLDLYQSKLDQGYNVYITEYGLGNEPHLHQSFNNVRERFSLTKVQSGCLDACNIYQVESTQAAQLR